MRVETKTDGLSMSYEIRGEGPLVVLVHGLFGTRATWQRVADILVGSGVRVLIPDLIGFGHSSRASSIDQLWIDSQAKFILAACREQSDHVTCIAGHDYGGPICVALHKLAPDITRTMVLSSCNLLADTPVPFPLNSWNWPIVGSLFRRLVLSRPSLRAFMAKANATKVPLPIDQYLGDAQQVKSTRLIFEHAIMRLSAAYSEVERELSNIAIATALLWGDADPFFTLAHGERTASKISGARFIRLEGCGHFAPEERPDAYAMAILHLVSDGSVAT